VDSKELGAMLGMAPNDVEKVIETIVVLSMLRKNLNQSSMSILDIGTVSYSADRRIVEIDLKSGKFNSFDDSTIVELVKEKFIRSI
jgi:hypothetical protein